MEEARLYADAYQKEVNRYPKKKQKEYWGDEDIWVTKAPKKEWQEMYRGNSGDPFMTPGIPNQTRWWS